MDSDMIYDFPCTSCQENGMNSDSVGYCEQCEKHFCSTCKDMHDRILKEHNIHDKTEHHVHCKDNDVSYVNIASVRYNTMEESQHGVLTYENVCGNSSVMGTKTESTRQEVDLDRPKPPPANEVMCEVLENPLTKLCGIVGKVSLHFEDKGIRIMRSDGKASVEIPLNMIRKFGRKQTIMFYFEVGRRFCFGEGFIIIKCCSPEDAKLVNSYLDEAFGKRK